MTSEQWHSLAPILMWVSWSSFVLLTIGLGWTTRKLEAALKIIKIELNELKNQVGMWYLVNPAAGSNTIPNTCAPESWADVDYVDPVQRPIYGPFKTNTGEVIENDG